MTFLERVSPVQPSSLSPPAACLQSPASWLSPARLQALVWAFVGLGVALRLVRFLLRFPLWGDECFVALNFLDRDYAGLARPLDWNQICPLWFLWAEMTAVKVLGFNEWSLRLVPTLFSVASVFLFRHVAGRLLTGIPWLLSVAIFCVSYYPIRHGAELKPYSGDLLVSLAILALAVAWLQSGRGRYGWWLAALMPLGLGFSYPAVFVAAAASGAVLLALFRRRLPGGWIPWLAFNGALAATFLVLYLTVARDQSQAAQAAGIHDYWTNSFPPLATPWKVPLWLLDMHTGRMFAYPIGGARGASVLSTILCAVGLVILWRQRERWISCLLVGPAALGLAASFAHAYPYGDSARVMQYFAPATCLLLGIGLAATLTLARWKSSPQHRVAVAVGLLLAIGGSSAIRDLIKPYKTEFDALNQSFARWIWHDLATDGEVACIQGDLGVPLFPAEFWRLSTLDYRCSQRIFSRRHKHGPQQPDWERIALDHPLWCVTYGYKGSQPDPIVLRDWLDQMSANYDLAGMVRLPLGSGGGVVFEQWYELYRFVPKGTPGHSTQAVTPAAGDAKTR